jgi:hypothetical protein
MNIPNTNTMRPVLEASLHAAASRKIDLLIVEDIAAWASAKGIEMNSNPIALATIEQPADKWIVVLRQMIDEDTIQGVIGRLEYGGHVEARKYLATPELFLRHTVLHELAHIQNGWNQDHEDDCDDWAFDHL